jgi:uncharacterized protein YfaS (alpha-2-macroglobulin family)
VPVTLTNTTGKIIKGRANLSVHTLGGFSMGFIPGPYAKTNALSEYATSPIIELPPSSEKRIVFRAVAAAIGTPKLNVTFISGIRSASGVAEGFTEETELPIRPAASLEKRTGSGVIAGGATLPLTLKADFLPASLTSRLVVSRSPLTEFSKDLRYLLQYPYGCLEQTVSAAFPQLYYADLAATLQQKTGAADKTQCYNPNYHVQ